MRRVAPINAIVTVLLNLLINAYKYTGADKQIAVRVFERDREVVLEIEDNGIGIPPADRSRIFDPFFRSDDRLRARSSGAGLGLAITKTLVSAHRGTIEVSSQEGLGTCMKVRVPVFSPNAGEPARR